MESYKAGLGITPDDLTANYNLGKAYFCTNPPQQLDGLWSYARAASSKSANEQQSKLIKGYLRKLVVNFQGGTVCDSVTDAEMNELLQLAASSVDRPASYKLISSADLDAARASMTIASVFTDLKAGGDKAKLTWTASCGLEFPEVPGKVIEVARRNGPRCNQDCFRHHRCGISSCHDRQHGVQDSRPARCRQTRKRCLRAHDRNLDFL